MKTPHVIEILLGGSGVPRYDPVTDTYNENDSQWLSVPCMVDVPMEATVLEDYGTREQVDIIARFLSMPPEFTTAKWNGERYTVVDRAPSGRKQSVRMRRVAR